MFRTITGFVGVIVALFPAKIRYLYERFAFKNPDEVNAKRWFTPAIRAEGLLFVLVSVIGGKAYRMSLYLLGLAGVVALFFPRRALRISANYSYKEPESIEWNRGLVQTIRCFGALCLLFAYNALTNSNRDPNSA